MIYENTPTIYTQRLLLRKFTKNDIDAFFELMSDETVNTFLPWFTVKTKNEAEKSLEDMFLSHYSNAKGYRYAICKKEDNTPIGYVCLSDNESYDFGYAIKKEFWNKGMVTEAAAAVIEKIKSAGYPYITATHDVNNLGSGKVMKKIGMLYKYSYVEQWQPKNFPVTFRMYQLNFGTADSFVYMEYWNKYEEHFIEEELKNM